MSQGVESWDEVADVAAPSALTFAHISFPSQKQRIRNLIAPKQDLGHSDKNAFGVKPSKDAGEGKGAGPDRKECEESAEPEPQVDDYTPRFRC